MTDKWFSFNLSDVVEIHNGIDYKSNPPGDTVPIYGTGGVIGHTSISLNSGPAILTGRKGTINKPFFIEGNFWNVDTVFCLKTKNDAVDIRLLYYILCNFDLTILNEATGVPSVTSSSLYRLRFTAPKNRNEQHHIANILTTCDEVIETTERLIEKYQAIKSGMLKDLMTRGIGEDGRLRPRPEELPLLYKDSCLGPIPQGWTVKRLEQLGTIYSGSTPSTADETYWGGNIPFVTPNDMSKTSHAFLCKTSRCITEKGLTKTNLIPGGNLVVSTRAPIGYLNLILNDFTTNQGCKSIVFNDQQYPLFHYYNMHMYVRTMMNYGVGTTFAEISKNDISKLQISLPDTLKEQQRIATILDSVDKEIQSEQKLLAKYRQIKQGLLKQLLTPCNGVN